ncbi:gas vesicle protein GvpJ [Rhodococcus sp. (in: high G+C Gram-positive bacteria)]|mgnify:CR=1 FL=1|uniref:gas vesicle protein GvpJ n=1 Tax=unclassified Rhodococcus (in: high G+C Gram-positive bacteria) TaxID=192944 RepID=UPI0019EB637A|nr:gas vesicle protein GvpJ [Rhodococcus sp. (in: high G+C Gram-positive bacteria)]MBF0660851.1 gas vesicle protein [Rhodococcus sp. (in: high G+C Gram-positive bacteria)]
MTVVGGGTAAPQPYGGGNRSTNLGDILERVLDKGLVIAGDIQVNLLDIELLTIKLRLVIASLETAKSVGIDWWENDPWLTSKARAPEIVSDRAELELENRRLRERLAALEAAGSTEPVEIVDEEDRG